MRFLDTLPLNILLVGDDPAVVQSLGKALTGIGRLRFATSGEQALHLAHEQPPDLVLLDADMALGTPLSGMQVLQALRAEPGLGENLPVILVSNRGDQATEDQGLALGAVDFVSKPIRPVVVGTRVRTHLQLKRAQDRLHRLANTDGLTGMANRRVLDEAVDREWRRSLRGNHPLALLLADIDQFHHYNEVAGFQAGDRCLICVARALQACISRPSDVVARVAGEKFAILLPDTDGAGAWFLAQQMLERVQHLAIEHAQVDAGRVTLSIGIACLDQESKGWKPADNPAMRDAQPRSAQSSSDLLAVAYQALHAAKRGGTGRAEFIRVDLSWHAPPQVLQGRGKG